MSRSKYDIQFARARHERWIKEGRGTGTGAAYSSWIKALEFPSLGDESQKVEGRHMRNVLALSKLEQELFDVLDCNPDLLEIYDQVPLDLGTTQDIAKDLGVKHPTAKGSNYPFVMTSDFVVDYQTPGGVIQIPFQAKYAGDVSNFHTAEKLEIERLYWLGKGSRLRIVTESPRCLPRTLVANAKSLQQNRFLDTNDMLAEESMPFEERRARVLNGVGKASAGTSLNAVAQALARETSVRIEAFTSVILHLLFKGTLVCNLHKLDMLQHDVADVQQRTATRQARKGGTR